MPPGPRSHRAWPTCATVTGLRPHDTCASSSRLANDSHGCLLPRDLLAANELADPAHFNAGSSVAVSARGGLANLVGNRDEDRLAIASFSAEGLGWRTRERDGAGVAGRLTRLQVRSGRRGAVVAHIGPPTRDIARILFSIVAYGREPQAKRSGMGSCGRRPHGDIQRAFCIQLEDNATYRPLFLDNAGVPAPLIAVQDHLGVVGPGKESTREDQPLPGAQAP